MKKVLCMMIVLVLALGTLCVSVSADSVTLLNPYRGDLVIGSTATVTDVDGFITGRTVTADASATIGSTNNGNFMYRTYAVNPEGTYTIAGNSTRFKNNFVWEFDINMSKVPATSNNAGCFYIQIGNGSNAWKNSIKIFSFDNNTSKYYFRWESNSNNMAISHTDSSRWFANSAYSCEIGKTYRLKIEVDARNDKMYVTFINPYITVENGVDKPTVHDTPVEWDNSDIFKQTTASTNTLGFTQSDISKVKDGANRMNVVMAAKSAIEFTTSNEKFYIDRFWAMTPEITADGRSVKAEANTINITNFDYTTNAPTLLLGVYQGNKLVGASINSQKGTLSKLTDFKYDATVENLADGTYTVKAFVWNSVDEMQPYPNCLAEKTLTVTGGVGTLN